MTITRITIKSQAQADSMNRQQGWALAVGSRFYRAMDGYCIIGTGRTRAEAKAAAHGASPTTGGSPGASSL